MNQAEGQSSFGWQLPGRTLGSADFWCKCAFARFGSVQQVSSNVRADWSTDSSRLCIVFTQGERLFSLTPGQSLALCKVKSETQTCERVKHRSRPIPVKRLRNHFEGPHVSQGTFLNSVEPPEFSQVRPLLLLLPLPFTTRHLLDSVSSMGPCLVKPGDVCDVARNRQQCQYQRQSVKRITTNKPRPPRSQSSPVPVLALAVNLGESSSPRAPYV